MCVQQGKYKIERDPCVPLVRTNNWTFIVGQICFKGGKRTIVRFYPNKE